MTWSASLVIMGAIFAAWCVLIGPYVVDLCRNRRDTKECEARDERRRREAAVEHAIACRRRGEEPASRTEPSGALES